MVAAADFSLTHNLMPSYSFDKEKGLTLEKAKEFSEMFLKFFFNKMMPEREDGYFGAGHSHEIYQSLWVESVAHSIAQADGFGIADNLMHMMNKNKAVAMDAHQAYGQAYGDNENPIGGDYDLHT